jgi:hypothetical protein
MVNRRSRAPSKIPTMIRMYAALLCLCLSVLAPMARADAPNKPAPAAAGTIKGTVIFEGEAPERATVKRDTDPYCAKVEKLSDDVVVTKGKLAGVLVRVKNGTMGTHAAPATPALLDQHDCAYTPHVIGLVVGQKLAVRNSDGTQHYVWGRIAGKQLWNKGQDAKAPDLTLDSNAKAGDVIDLKCGSHPWMQAYAVVQDHPFFAVTGDDGAFEIKGLAAGTYTLEAWHPTLGTKTLEVKIGKGARGQVSARFSYKAN